MKVLFLTRYPYEGASSRYRVYQYLPHLKELGIEAKTQSFMSPHFYKVNFTQGQFTEKTLLTLVAFMKRLWALLFFWRYDVIYMQREILPFGPIFIERILKVFGATLIFDYDDALFIYQKSTHNKLMNFLRAPNRIYKIFSTSDCVMAGNNYLRDVAADYCKNSYCFEVAEDTVRIQMRPPQSNNNGVRIGWLGSTSTVKYLELIQEPLKHVCEKYDNITIENIGCLLYTSPSPRDQRGSRMPSSA